MQPTLQHLRPFGPDDYMAWAGVESANPLIFFSDYCVVIVDDNNLILDVSADECEDTREYSCAYGSHYLAATVGDHLAARILSMGNRLTPQEFMMWTDGLATDLQLQRTL